MITVCLTSQLGNMMFQYAAVKTIASKNNCTFRYVRYANTGYINSCDSQYGCELNTIFKLPPEEQLFDIPTEMDTYVELEPSMRDYSDYPNDVFKQITDNTFVRGFFITPEIIETNIENVRKWFELPSSAIDKAVSFLKPYKQNEKKVCIVHFRVGYDYFILGYKLHKSYWHRAATLVQKRYPNVQFICVYDKFTSDVKSFMEEFPSEKYHGSLVDDLAMITLADINIVCNSSFSIMGALLNPRSCMAVCPSIYPTPAGNLPDNTYAKSWIRIPQTKRDLASQMTWNMRKIAKALLPIKLLKKLLKR